MVAHQQQQPGDYQETRTEVRNQSGKLMIFFL